uniref:T9SS type A sorting domain-containing protein n=1 Tax=Flavobacterium sp. TaxID=239 RepID=UPI00374DC02C
WGYNYYWQLADGTTNNKNIPQQIGTDNDWVKATGGETHAHALKANNTLWGWGFNYEGQVGDGTTANRLYPIQIGTETTWVEISEGRKHGLGLKYDGTLWGWGDNDFGQIGDGTTNQHHSPQQVGTSENWTMISSMTDNSSGMQNDMILLWGSNQYGQLGNGNTGTLQNSPVMIGCTTLGTSEFASQNRVRIYPNPATSIIHFDNGDNFQLKNVEIIDLTGKVIISNNKSESIDISNLSSGVYVVKTHGDNFTEIQKLIKQ